MDYIIFGIGAGSSLVVVGWLLRDWGPALRDRKARLGTEVLTAQQMVDQMRWARFCGSCGTALAIGGAFVLLLTTIAIVVNPSDDRGATITLAAFGCVSIAMLIWSWLFVRRFGAAGVFRRKPASVPAYAAPEERTLLDQDQEDVAYGQVAIVPEPGRPDAELVPRRGFRSKVLKNPFASRRAKPEIQAPIDANGDVSGEDQQETPSAAEPESAIVVETATGDQAEPKDESLSEDEESERIETPEEAAVDVSSADQDAEEGVSGTDPAQVSEATAEVVSADRDDDAGAEIQHDVATPTSPDPEQDGALEESGSEPTETLSGREKALRNLRQRRLSRLTHDPS